MKISSVSTQTSYFVRTIAGTEKIAWLDIKKLPSTQLIAINRRLIEFNYGGSPERLLNLRSVDDVYVLAGRLDGLDKTRSSLQKITQQISSLPLVTAIEICKKTRPISSQPSYRVTASLTGRRNYSRYDVAEAIHNGLKHDTNWSYIEQSETSQLPDIDLRILIESDEGIVGVRLGQIPLHRRSYKIKNLPGSLKPPVAYCMGLLAGIQPDEVVLDPMCGVGTIVIEAILAFNIENIYGLDVNTEAIRYATANASEVKAKIHFQIGDATQLPCLDNYIDCIICNLPWGRQIQTPDTLRKTYSALTSEFLRVTKEKSRIVLLTDRTGLLLQQTEMLPNLHLVFARQVSLFGSHPTICILVKDINPPNPLNPFGDSDSLKIDLNELIYESIIDNLNHPDFRIRIYAAKACAYLQNSDVVYKLQPLLADEDGRVRRVALDILNRLDASND